MIIEALTKPFLLASENLQRLIDDPRAWSPMTVFDRNTITGEQLTEEDVLYCGVAWRCMIIRAETVAKLSRKLVREKDDGRVERIYDHNISKMLRRAGPTTKAHNLTWFDYDVTKVLRLDVYNNYFDQILRNGRGEPQYLNPLNPTRMIFDSQPNKELKFKFNAHDGQHTLGLSEVHWVRGPSLNPLQGMSACQAALDAISLARSYAEFALRYFENDASVPFFLKHKLRLGEDARRKILDDFDARHRGKRNKFRMGLLDGDMDAIALRGDSIRDADLAPQQRLIIAEIARYFGVPLHKLMELERSTNNNIQQQALEFYTDCIHPLIKLIEEAMTRDLLTEADQLKGFRIEYEVDELIWADPALRRELSAKLVVSCVYTPNEARAELGLGPKPNGDDLLYPTANAPLSKIYEEPEPVDAQVLKDEDSKKLPDKEKDKKDAATIPALKAQILQDFEPLFRDICGRLVNREKESFESLRKKMTQADTETASLIFAQFYKDKHAHNCELALLPTLKTCARLVDIEDKAVSIMGVFTFLWCSQDIPAIADIEGDYWDTKADKQAKSLVDLIVSIVQKEAEDVPS